MVKVRITSRDLIPLTLSCAVGHYDSPQPRPAQDQTSQQLSHSSDTSIPLFAQYLQTAEEFDWRRFELLKGDSDQILVFVSP